jgi:quercetin dioxygenase-like cupin family protein
MHIVRFRDAPAYSAGGHFDMAMVRLQGLEAGPSSTLWIGVSIIEPGGGTSLSSSPAEKMYVVLDGQLEISNGDNTVGLERWDSCRIAPGESRRLENNSKEVAMVLLAMPLTSEQRAGAKTREQSP